MMTAVCGKTKTQQLLLVAGIFAYAPVSLLVNLRDTGFAGDCFVCQRTGEKTETQPRKKKHVISLETLTLSHEQLTISNTSKVNREGETQVCIVQLVG